MKDGNKYGHVLSFFYGSAWAILPDKFREIEAVLWKRIEAGLPEPKKTYYVETYTPKVGEPWPQPKAFDDAGTFRDTEERTPYQMVGSAAVVKVHGTITPRPSVFSDWSGGTSAEGLGKAVEQAAADGKVEQIVLDVDSPGGSVYGMPENAAKILAARKSKPVTAVANHTAASAAYWFASQASSVAVTPAGQVGSVGVLWAHSDYSKFDEAMGVKTTYVHAGDYKVEGAPEFPLSDAARAEMQRVVNEYYAMFLGAVSAGRRIDTRTVEKDFGQGRMRMADEAVAAGMADRVATLEQVLGDANGARTGRMKRRIAADLANLGLPTA